eukprot:TRINITY_DN24027_c0_g1_i2.p1 TRINITY_DN24027_c0_g1~~TRINITY_DN24027_c0_g1_i2.p1  ORF type:complete len:480 (+),score=60.37 TRINITY_DN24027_c0_g1_i2:46-1485(+)
MADDRNEGGQEEKNGATEGGNKPSEENAQSVHEEDSTKNEAGDQTPITNYIEPSKQVRKPNMIEVWEESEAYQQYLGFIIDIGESLQGRKISEQIQISENCDKLLKILDQLRQYADDTPPIEMQARYGNPAYRDWFDLLDGNADALVAELLPEELSGAAIELVPYLVESFGNDTRIDYGTGHEMTFVMFVCGLFKIGFLKEDDKLAVGLKVFSKYFDLCRYLQTRYRMEPAGSMGVWNLDDYQFVAFILGAAQLLKGAKLKPKSIPDPEMADMLKKDFHLFACLAFIHQVKSGPFHEHSNQLWNISAVQLWSKVFTGLIKMYRAEVLCKFPVIQHALFGSIFSLEKAKSKRELPGDAPPGGSDPNRTPRMPGPGGMHPGVAGLLRGIPGMPPMMGMPPGPGSLPPGPGSMPPGLGSMPVTGMPPGLGGSLSGGMPKPSETTSRGLATSNVGLVPTIDAKVNDVPGISGNPGQLPASNAS